MAVALYHHAFGDRSKPIVFMGIEHPRRRSPRRSWEIAIEIGEPTISNIEAARARLNEKAA